MNSLFQLEIPRRAGQCAGAGEKLISGMEIISLLLEEEDTGKISRQDYCSSCWPSVPKNKQDKFAPKGFWKSKIEKRMAIEGSSRLERALSLLRSLLTDSELREDEIYVLCLFLSHARHIVLRQEFQKDGDNYHLYEIIRKEEFITIKVIYLTQVQIEKVQKAIAQQLSS